MCVLIEVLAPQKTQRKQLDTFLLQQITYLTCMARRLFQNYFCQLYHVIIYFVYLSSLNWHHLLLLFGTYPLDIWRSERDCRINIYSVSCTRYSVGCVHHSVSFTNYSDGCKYFSSSVGCIHYTVGCKHLLCRLYALLYRL